MGTQRRWQDGKMREETEKPTRRMENARVRANVMANHFISLVFNFPQRTTFSLFTSPRLFVGEIT